MSRRFAFVISCGVSAIIGLSGLARASAPHHHVPHAGVTGTQSSAPLVANVGHAPLGTGASPLDYKRAAFESQPEEDDPTPSLRRKRAASPHTSDHGARRQAHHRGE